MRRSLGYLALAAQLASAAVASAQTYTVLYTFGTAAHDPSLPTFSGTIAQGRDGNLYSTAPSGGANNLGAVFKFTPAGAVTVLHSFTAAEGSSQSGLTLGTDGNFYGATTNGGTSGFGTVFKVTPSGVLTILHSFNGTDGAEPEAPPIQATDGNWYGTTVQGGGSGSIYKMTPAGVVTTLHNFISTDGYQPCDPLVQGTDGNLYGTTRQGGSSLLGVVFKITRTGTFTVLFNFDGAHGSQPVSPLIQAADGNFYGSTQNGGTSDNGVVFKITPGGKLTVLHQMDAAGDGSIPMAGLVQATDLNFYGGNASGGSVSAGTLFRMAPSGTYTVVHNHDSSSAAPEVTLLQHTGGILFGDTHQGTVTTNCNGCGTLFSLNAGLGPFVSILPPTIAGKVGSTVQILGQGFTGTTGVSFNGTPAQFSVKSGTFLTATVPNGAQTGTVTVTTPGGTLTSNKSFRVTPQITGFSPPSGPVGTQVIITGVSLRGASNVTFGGVKATQFSVDSDQQVTATVPANAKTGKIQITTSGGTAQSATDFTVTT